MIVTQVQKRKPHQKPAKTIISQWMLKQANELQYAQKYEQAVELYDKFISSNPEQDNLIAALYNKAQALDELGQFAQAAGCYAQIITRDSKHLNGELFYEQGQLYQKARMLAQSSLAYKQYLARYPNHSECSFNLGRALQAMGQLQQAVLYFQKACQCKQGYGKAYKAKIAVLKKLNRQEQVLITCSEGLRHEPTDFELIYESGMACFKLGRFKEAYAAFKESIGANRKFVRGYISLCEVSLKLEKDQEGLEVLHKCLKDNRDVMKSTELKEINVWTGVIKMNLKDYKGAISCFSLVLSQPPIIESVKSKLAFCFEEEGNISFSKKNFSDALQCYSEALKYDPRGISLLNNAGLAYQNINNLKQAQICFKKALALQPANVRALNNLATLQHAKGNEAEAQAILDKLTQSNPENYITHFNSGKQYLRLHKYKQALQEFRKIEDRQGNDFRLFNDMAVALQYLGQYEQALKYAHLANELTESRSPLMLLNRASILMKLRRLGEAREDLDRASREVGNPDRSFLVKLGVTAENFKFIFNQLNHYAYLMTPINVFRQGLAKELQSHADLQHQEVYSAIVQKVEQAEEFALEQVMVQLKKEVPSEPAISAQKARSDLTAVQSWIDDAKQLMHSMELRLQQQDKQLQQQEQVIANMRMDMSAVKRESREMREKLKYLPQSCNLRQKLQQLYQCGDRQIWQYGKQLYWILNGYLTGYMLVHSGVVGKGGSIDRSTFGSALAKLGGIMEFAQNIPVVGEFSELISRICGLFVDLEDDVIIKKMYEAISFNYDTQEELNDAICTTVVLFLSDPLKIQKVRNKMVFDPPQGFVERVKQTLEDVSAWFEQKKNEFVTHMRGYEKAENIIQSELAVIDVGLLISIMLSMESNSQMKHPVLTNAAKKALADCKLEEMVCEAYNRENENIRVSTNSFCTVMRLQLLYDNHLLNCQPFMRFVAALGSEALRKVLNWTGRHHKSHPEHMLRMLERRKFQQILSRLD